MAQRVSAQEEELLLPAPPHLVVIAPPGGPRVIGKKDVEEVAHDVLLGLVLGERVAVQVAKDLG